MLVSNQEITVLLKTFKFRGDVGTNGVFTRFSGYHTVPRSDHFWGDLWTDLIIEQVMTSVLKSSGGLTRGRSVSESVRQLWIGRMHRCASIQNAIEELTGAWRKTSEQHTELGASRIKRDHNDLGILNDCFKI